MAWTCRSWLVDSVLGMKLKTLVASIAVIVFMTFAGIYYITKPTARETFARVHHMPLPKQGLAANVNQVNTALKVIKNYRGSRLPSPKRSEAIQKLLGDLLPEFTIFEVDKFPEDHRLWPSIGNGHIATVVNSGVLYMNGLYNGLVSISHRAKLPSLVSMDIAIASPKAGVTNTYSLDVGQGIYRETMKGSFFVIEKIMYAHRTIKELFVVEVRVKIHDHPTREPLILKLSVAAKPESEDIEFVKKTCDIASVHCSYIHGKSRQAETGDTEPSEVHIYYTDIPDNITLNDGMMEETSQLYLMSVSHLENKAKKEFDNGLRLNQRHPLWRGHVAAWAGLWDEGRIEMEGRKQLSELNYASLYYLLSSLPLKDDPQSPYNGLSSGGLARDPQGHVLVDQERWAFPPVLMLHSNISRHILEYRTRRLEMAKKIAESHLFHGAMYPSESAHSGVEVSSDQSPQLDQLRVTGNIALAVQQYVWMTKNSAFLSQDQGSEMVTSIAEFWASRIKYNPENKQYGILGVLPPGGNQSPIDNSAYINSIAKASLLLASQVIPLKSLEKYRAFADGMYIPFDEKLKYHPEFDGYKSGSELTQTDVLSLGFPVSEHIPSDVRKNDLEMYEKVASSNSHSLMWSPFAVGWLELNNMEKAAKFLNRSIGYAMGPFKVWQEYKDERGTADYIPAMGDYLQTILFGYGGFRIHEKSLVFNPVLPPSVTRFIIRNVDYLGQSLTFTFDAENTQVTLMPSSRDGISLVVMDLTSLHTHVLKPDIPVIIKAGRQASVIAGSS